MRKKLVLCSIMMILCSVLFCSNGTVGAATKGKITKVSITKPATETLTMTKGSTYQMKVSIKGTAKNKKLAYKTSNSKVVKVSKAGKLKAVKKGSAKITVSSKFNSKKKDTLTVTVGTKVSKVALDKSTAALKVGEKVTLNATISPAKASNKKVSWKSSDSSVAEVSGGVVTAKKIGSADITVTAKDGSGKKAVCKVTVAANTVFTNLDDVKVTTERLIKVKLSAAKVLSASDFAASMRMFGSNANSLNVNKIYTKDNINYNVYLKTPISYGYYVTVTIPSLDGVKTKEAQYNVPLQLKNDNIVSGVVGQYFRNYFRVPNVVGNISCKLKTGTLPAGIELEKNQVGNYIGFTGIAKEVANGTEVVISISDETGKSADVKVKFYIGSENTIVLPIENTKILKADYTQNYYTDMTQIYIDPVGGSDDYYFECVSTPSAISLSSYGDSAYIRSYAVGNYDLTVKVTDKDNASISTTTVIHVEVSAGYTLKGVLVNEKGEKLKDYDLNFSNISLGNSSYATTDKNGAFSVKVLPGQYYGYVGDDFSLEDFTVVNSDLDLGEIVIPNSNIVKYNIENPTGLSSYYYCDIYEVANDQSTTGRFLNDGATLEDGIHYLYFEVYYNGTEYYARKTITMNGDDQTVTVSAGDWIKK